MASDLTSILVGEDQRSVFRRDGPSMGHGPVSAGGGDGQQVVGEVLDYGPGSGAAL
ncbi:MULTISPECIES: hypothetical protein [Nocardiaceae]|uniref:hypothetical protein n=1 Tax=Nocardiaceae TaxID=85025 RepID=UPI0012D2A317|nr:MULTISPECIES: hypothetical protein [Rhodococcus]